MLLSIRSSSIFMSCVAYPVRRWQAIALSTLLIALQCIISVSWFCDHRACISSGGRVGTDTGRAGYYENTHILTAVGCQIDSSRPVLPWQQRSWSECPCVSGHCHVRTVPVGVLFTLSRFFVLSTRRRPAQPVSVQRADSSSYDTYDTRYKLCGTSWCCQGRRQRNAMPSCWIRQQARHRQ